LKGSLVVGQIEGSRALGQTVEEREGKPSRQEIVLERGCGALLETVSGNTV
jgi:hypothetical protein